MEPAADGRQRRFLRASKMRAARAFSSGPRKKEIAAASLDFAPACPMAHRVREAVGRLGNGLGSRLAFVACTSLGGMQALLPTLQPGGRVPGPGRRIAAGGFQRF
jgi:hypothetical protein